MPHKGAYVSALAAVLALPACDRQLADGNISKEIVKHFELSGRKSIDLAQAVAGPWEKVCILGPYTDNTGAKATLGFEWDAQSKTSILANEGVSLLLFVRGDEVIQYVEHPRAHGDFSNLTRKCFPREKAEFVQDNAPSKGWPGLFSKYEA